MFPKFEIEFLEEAFDFIESQPQKSREKIIYNLRKASLVNDSDLLKKLNENVWEFRTLFAGTQYRLFAFWIHKEGKITLVVVTHGMIKKTSKVPQKEIEKTEKIRVEFLKQKGYVK